MSLKRRKTRSRRIVLTSDWLSSGIALGAATTMTSTGSTEMKSGVNHPRRYFLASFLWLRMSSPVFGSGHWHDELHEKISDEDEVDQLVDHKESVGLGGQADANPKGVTKQVEERDRGRDVPVLDVVRPGLMNPSRHPSFASSGA